MKTILGTGQLGIAVMETLLKNNPGEEILLVNKSGRLEGPVSDQVSVMAADVTSQSVMKDIAARSEVIYSCTDVPYPLWADFYPATAAALAYALEKTEARLVFADNMYSYGNVMGKEMTENLPHQAKTRKGRIRTAVIDTLLRSGKAFNNRVAFVKAADFVGPRIYKGLFGTDFLGKLYEGNAIMLFGNIRLPHSFTYIHDFAEAIVKVGNEEDAFGQVWHVPNAQPLNLKEWVRLFEEETGKKANVTVLPKSVVWLTGLLNPLVREYYELSYQFEYPYRVNHSKFVNRFGNHATPPSAIVKKTVDWYKSTVTS